jgi:hypothetical protein
VKEFAMLLEMAQSRRDLEGAAMVARQLSEATRALEEAKVRHLNLTPAPVRQDGRYGANPRGMGR